ncbi:alpha/beta hydrolase [Oxalobacteraceae bacterium OTU3CINTB1]|nr:alpha/beta hydrolase [Oxalobacteraceae bacterium OTU3CINTB1]
MPSKLLFLPGALGRMDFWLPASQLIRNQAEKIHIGWPGFGSTRPEADVNGIDDLVAKVVSRLDSPCALIAQSMGGVVAIRAALARPDNVTHLILAATSGGLNMDGLGAEDWRAFVKKDYPTLPEWFLNYHEDLTERLSEIRIPVLLLWGGADPISPVKVGEKLAKQFAYAKLVIFEDADHDLAHTNAVAVATLIDQHLNTQHL